MIALGDIEKNLLGGGWKYEYNSNGRVEFEIQILAYLGERVERKTQKYYDSKGQITKEYHDNGRVGTSWSLYSDYVYDSHGNWTSRKKNGDKIETRTIEYY